MIRDDQRQMDEDRAFGDHVDAQATWHADAEAADEELPSPDGGDVSYTLDEWGIPMPLPKIGRASCRERV